MASASSSINASSIASKVIVYGNGGSDFIDLAFPVTTPATVYGGSGNDMIRCGAGNETVVNGGGFDQVFRPFTPGAPFVNGEAVSDIRQGYAPLCQTDAAIAEAVQEGHNFCDGHHLPGQQYLQREAGWQYPGAKGHNFDGWSNSADPAVSGSEFWTVLEPRARLQSLGIDPTVQHTPAGWNAFNQNDGYRLYSISDAALRVHRQHRVLYPRRRRRPRKPCKPDLAAWRLRRRPEPTRHRRQSRRHHRQSRLRRHGGLLPKRHVESPPVQPLGHGSRQRQHDRFLDTSAPAANDGFITLSWAQFTNTANYQGFFVAAKK